MSNSICVNDRIAAMTNAIKSGVEAEMRIRQMFRRQITTFLNPLLRLTLFIVYAQTKHTNVKLDGDFANFTFVDEGTGAFSFLQVSRGGTAEDPQTSLFFQTEHFDLVNNRVRVVSGFVTVQVGIRRALNYRHRLAAKLF